MTKKQAEEQFREHHVPAILQIEKESGGGMDEPRRAQDWNDYTDALCKGGQITSAQYSNWHHPRWLYSKNLCVC